jgi:hypothetical protein
MAQQGQQGRTTLKGYFNTGDKPTESQFSDFIDSVPNTIDDYGVQFASVELSSAQILSLNSSPVEIVAAPGAGKVIVPHKFSAYLQYGTSVYATNTSITFAFSRNPANTIHDPMTILGQSEDSYSSYPIYSISMVASEYINDALVVYVRNGDPTAGDGTLKIYVWYSILTL